MALNQNTFLADFVSFAKESMTWCIEESEKEVSRIYVIIQDITEDLKRRSQMSDKTISAIQKIENVIVSQQSDQVDVKLDDLIKELYVLRSENEELFQLVNPIIESLQFQDRLRQNLDNFSKMFVSWMNHRKENPSESDILLFGEDLLKKTTAQNEREVIRSIIPGLPEEKKVESQTLFF